MKKKPKKYEKFKHAPGENFCSCLHVEKSKQKITSNAVKGRDEGLAWIALEGNPLGCNKVGDKVNDWLSANAWACAFFPFS